MIEKCSLPSGSSGNFLTPLRYPGGKGRLGPWLGKIIEANGLKGGWYVEPYAGGAGAALFLLAHDFVDRIVINDMDPVIHAFWLAVTMHTDEFIEKIRTTAVTLEERAKCQDLIRNPHRLSTIDLGFATFFLNRTSRSGILAGGVIGGKEQKGKYKLDARFNKENLIARIRLIGSMADRITVLGLDALELLTVQAKEFPVNTLIYLDPPYFIKGSQLYRNYYSAEDHAVIAESVKRLQFPALVTYDDCEEIRGIYQGVNFSNFQLHYSTHMARPNASEVLFYANLILPQPPEMTRAHHLRPTAQTQATLSL